MKILTHNGIHHQVHPGYTTYIFRYHITIIVLYIDNLLFEHLSFVKLILSLQFEFRRRVSKYTLCLKQFIRNAHRWIREVYVIFLEGYIYIFIFFCYAVVLEFTKETIMRYRVKSFWEVYNSDVNLTAYFCCAFEIGHERYLLIEFHMLFLTWNHVEDLLKCLWS